MTCCRSDRMFFYSNSAQSDPEFSQYKTNLENEVNWYDRYTNALLYTPYATAVTFALVSALRAGLDSASSYSTLFNVLQIGIPILSSGILGLSKGAQKNSAGRVKDLISSGVKMSFFKIVPSELPTTEPTDTSMLIEDDQHQIHSDAMNHRILGV
jgi:hypothetical protein